MLYDTRLARLAGIEPATYGLEGRCSIRLSYRRMVNIGRGRRIRTNDPLLPKQMRYQTALYPECPTEQIGALQWSASIVIDSGLRKEIFWILLGKCEPVSSDYKCYRYQSEQSYLVSSKSTLTRIATTGNATEV